MPEPDPASLNVAVTITGMDHHEAAHVVANLPAGSTAAVTVTQPALGGKRYKLETAQLSVKGAADMTTALYMRAEQVWEQGQAAAQAMS